MPGKRAKPKGPQRSFEERLPIYQEIEDMMFLQGSHREAVVDFLVGKYKCERETARKWVRETQAQWRASIDGEDLSERHYQLDRMAHHLYGQAMTGIDLEVQKKIAVAIEKIEAGKIDEAKAILVEVKGTKHRDLKVAQRVLWNLCAMSGYGNKVTIDVSGHGVTIGPPRE